MPKLRSLVLMTLLVFPGLALAASGRAPVVFAHGLGVPAAMYEHAVPLKAVFAKHGYVVHVARTPVSGDLDERSAVLEREIRRLVPEGPYHLIGHSMGGLDARLAIQRYGLGERCLSLTTLSTPHRGSALADWVERQADHALGGDATLEGVLKLFGGDLDSVRNLTTRHLEERFNPVVLDDARVRYFSMGFYVPQPVSSHASVPLLWIAHGLLSRLGEPLNDGPVPTRSAVWGEFLGAYPGDHYSETAPIPFAGKMIYRQVFERALKNLDRKFGDRRE